MKKSIKILKLEELYKGPASPPQVFVKFGLFKQNLPGFWQNKMKIRQLWQGFAELGSHYINWVLIILDITLKEINFLFIFASFSYI